MKAAPSLLLHGLLALGLTASAAVSPHYINRSPVTYAQEPPQIDAVSFENRSTFTILSQFGFGEPFLFETFNTLNFTNTASGRMSADPGFWFDHSYATGRGMMANWVNRGLVSAPINLIISSSNILNSGLGLGVGSQGALLIEGNNVNVSRSGLYSGPQYGTGGGGFSFGGGIGFALYPPNLFAFSEGSFKDSWWAVGSNTIRLDQLNLTLPSPRTPLHLVSSRTAGGFPFSRLTSLPVFGLTNGNSANYGAFVFTNVFDTTNVISVVFLPVNSTNIGLSSEVRWTQNLDDGAQEVGTGGGFAPLIRLGFPDLDPITQLTVTNFVFIEDYLPFQTTNLLLLPNLSSAAFPASATRRPNTTWLGKSPSGHAFFDLGSETNATYDPAMLTSGSFASNAVPGRYAAHSARLVLGENLLAATSVFRPGDLHWSGLPINDITNFAGRIEIHADRLNLDNVRIRAESGLVIRANDLQGTSLPLVSAPLISYDVRSKQDLLTISNLIPSSANRLLGEVATYSTIWENAITNASLTNFYKLHVLFVDYSLSITQLVSLQDLKLHGNHVVIADRLRVGRELLLDATNLTITATGDLLNGTAYNLGGSNLVNLQNFTNYGVLSSQRDLALGSDGSSPLSNLVNFGLISAASLELNSGLIINSNIIYATNGSLALRGENLRLLGATNVLQSFGSVLLSGGNLYASNTTILAGSTNGLGALVVDFTNSVADAGAASSNYWFTTDGMVIARAPLQGDLPYTTIYSLATNESEVIHVIGAVDYGVSPLGYEDNLAIGRLVLDGTSNTLFRFSPPPGASNVALYVDYLELKNYATNFAVSIVVDEGCKLYFANSNISPKRDLNHLSDDRLRWVSTYAGPHSTTNFTYTVNAINYSVDVNLALARLSDIDSDNDGLANRDDPTPIWIPAQAPLRCTLTNFANKINVPRLSGEALVTYYDGASTNVATNTIEYTLDLLNGPWSVLTNLVLPTVMVVPPQSLPFVVLDLGATNKVRHYRMSVRVTDP
ncbi:MAG: hypothetical protein FJ405_11235 [Verrucomicrobia bacterium]|nr:hypothetical protein [Verrucomicrobiota bacterium]